MQGGDGTEAPVGMPRQTRRKAQTRQRILTAAQGLFAEQGYADTSIEEISVAADVAIRTIYLHFPSKAAIMLAYFDGWLDAFVGAIGERPAGEPVVESVQASLAAMAEAGWVDRSEDDISLAYPFLDQVTSGSPDIAGHVLQRWFAAIDDLAEADLARGAESDPLTARARAAAVFAAWVANMSAVRASQHGHPLPPGSTGNSAGMTILGRLTGGEL